MATITGDITAVDSTHQAQLVGSDLRVGYLRATDATHMGFLEGVVIDDTTSVAGDKSFVQDTVLDSDGLTLTLFDSTYVGGSYSGDGTYFDSTYWEPRLFNPLWIDYSIWYTPDTTTEMIQGTPKRVPMNPTVGYFYANMYSPDRPGDYEIRWRYQKDPTTLGKEVRESFTVTTFGIDPE